MEKFSNFEKSIKNYSTLYKKNFNKAKDTFENFKKELKVYKSEYDQVKQIDKSVFNDFVNTHNKKYLKFKNSLPTFQKLLSTNTIDND